jgi:hypothetical protein
MNRRILLALCLLMVMLVFPPAGACMAVALLGRL